jgi:hypothetical protein
LTNLNIEKKEDCYNELKFEEKAAKVTAYNSLVWESTAIQLGNSINN